jgi:hypothetical protein
VLAACFLCICSVCTQHQVILCVPPTGAAGMKGLAGAGGKKIFLVSFAASTCLRTVTRPSVRGARHQHTGLCLTLCWDEVSDVRLVAPTNRSLSPHLLLDEVGDGEGGEYHKRYKTSTYD